MEALGSVKTLSLESQLFKLHSFLTKAMSRCSVSERGKYQSTQENGSWAIETKDEAFQTELMQPRLSS